MLNHQIIGPTVVYIDNPLDMSERSVKRVVGGRSISELAPDTPYPIVCALNGQPISRADWVAVPSQDDHVSFIRFPKGGGGGLSLIHI